MLEVAQFDVYKPSSGPLVVVVQHDLLDAASTRVIIPLIAPDRLDPPMNALNPSVEIDGRMLLVATQFIATLSVAELGTKVGTLQSDRDRITRAIDALLGSV